ncbi:MAG TPA: hypothetical protein VIJ12_04515 [Candidatus Baltobacteraceae bacterium]
MRQPTSVGGELLWLLAFLAIFFVLTFLVLKFFVAYQHFNDRIAIMLCAIVSGLIWIALRAANARRA